MFEIETPNGTNDGVALTTLHAFTDGTIDGSAPTGGVYFAQNGMALLGTTTKGGANAAGTVYELSGPANTETIVHSFSCATSDVCDAQGTLIADVNGNFYGTGLSGGSASGGGGFILTLQSNATYIESLLFSLTGGTNGSSPASALAIGGTKLYGVSGSGGTGNCDGHPCGVLFSSLE